MHAVSRSELRTWQVMPYFRVAYIASTSLPCFSVRCSHVIFLISFLLSCYLRLGIYNNNNNFRTFTYLSHTLAYMAFGLWSAPIRYVFLPYKAEHLCMYIWYIIVQLVLSCFIHQHTSFKNLFSRLAYFSRRPPRMMGVIAGQNVMRTWPSSVSRQLLLLLMALALMFLYLTFHCRQDFWCLSSQKKIGWDGPHGVTLGTQNKFGTRVHLTNETIA